MDALVRKVTAARAVAPMEPLVAEMIKYGYQKAEDAFLLGTTPAYETVHDLYVEKGRFDPPERSKASAWSHPVLANGRLYVRDNKELICLELPK